MIGYKYTIEEDAINARQQAAEYKGLPLNPGDVTIYWVNYSFAEFNNPQFWYIQYVKGLEIVLGEPIEFEVIQPNPFDETN